MVQRATAHMYSYIMGRLILWRRMTKKMTQKTAAIISIPKIHLPDPDYSRCIEVNRVDYKQELILLCQAPSNHVFNLRLASIKGCLPQRVVFYLWASSIKSRLPSKYQISDLQHHSFYEIVGGGYFCHFCCSRLPHCCCNATFVSNIFVR